MRNHIRYIAAALMLSLALAPVVAQDAAAKVDVKALLAKIDAINDFTASDFSGLYTIVTEKPGEKQSVTQARMFRRDKTDQFLMLILLPEADKGQGYLMEGDNFWFYDPTSRKFNHSSVKEAISDSEVKNSDMTKHTLTDDYDVLSAKDGKLGKFPVWIIELKAKTTDVSYELMRLYVRQDQALVLKEEDMSVSGRLMRTTLYPKYADLGGGKFYPSQMLIVDEVNKGEKSQLTLAEMSTEKLPDKVFTKAFMEQSN